MKRVGYFENIGKNISPLLQIPVSLEEIMDATANDRVGDLLAYASRLSDLGTASAKARAAFIRFQIAGIDAEDIFEEYRESWGIPVFQDDLVSIGDFRNGFLWTFRDHSTSWSEDVEARNWFYTNTEARFARRYEFWACDHGPEEIVFRKRGDYKSILLSIVEDADFGPFISPVFSRTELRTFYENFDEDQYGFEKDSLLEIMERNENW